MMIINLAFKNYLSNLNYTVATSKGLLATCAYIPVHRLIASAAETMGPEETEANSSIIIVSAKYVKGMVGV